MEEKEREELEFYRNQNKLYEAKKKRSRLKAKILLPLYGLIIVIIAYMFIGAPLVSKHIEENGYTISSEQYSKEEIEKYNMHYYLEQQAKTQAIFSTFGTVIIIYAIIIVAIYIIIAIKKKSRG